MRLAYAAVLDKPGQVFEPAIYGSLRVSPSESGFYGSQVRGIRIIGRLGFHQEVIALIKDHKLLILREVVGAKGFEPSTSWSRRLFARKINKLHAKGRIATECYKCNIREDLNAIPQAPVALGRARWWAQNWAQPSCP